MFPSLFILALCELDGVGLLPLQPCYRGYVNHLVS